MGLYVTYFTALILACRFPGSTERTASLWNSFPSEDSGWENALKIATSASGFEEIVWPASTTGPDISPDQVHTPAGDRAISRARLALMSKKGI
jgi:hypothetical protein